MNTVLFSFDMQFRLSHRARKQYLEKLAGIFREVGFRHTLFTCDGGIVPVVNFARLGHIKGLFPGTNDSKFLSVAHHTVRKFYDHKGPYYIPEEYAGWFTHWGDAHVFHRDVEKYKAHIEALLQTDFSFCYYMVHGGTNFGYSSGTNYRRRNEVWPIVTSYDYGAPIDEAGNATPLYDSLRAVYQSHTHLSLPDVPKPIPTMAIDHIELRALSFSASYPTFTAAADALPQTFEQKGQASGYILYEKAFAKAKHCTLSTKGLYDYTVVLINDSLVETIDRNMPVGKIPRSIHLDIPDGGRVRILVENAGRINFGSRLWRPGKGATQGILIDGKQDRGWFTQSLPMDKINMSVAVSQYKAHQPVFYQGTFELTHTADTYLDMHGFGKGIVIINGHHLGRYWEVGPQFYLYVPGVWLREGKNDIVIFDQINHGQMHSIAATARPENR